MQRRGFFARLFTIAVGAVIAPRLTATTSPDTPDRFPEHNWIDIGERWETLRVTSFEHGVASVETDRAAYCIHAVAPPFATRGNRFWFTHTPYGDEAVFVIKTRYT